MVNNLFYTPFESRVVRLTHLAAFIAFTLGTNRLSAQQTPAKLPDQVAKKVVMQTKLVNQLWKGQGNVIVGRLEISQNIDPQQIASRTVLFGDGWFAARLYSGRTLTFLPHGFKPIEIKPPQDAPLVFDAGTIKLELVDKNDLSKVRGIAAFPESSERRRI